mgnify:FL=1
MPTAGGLCGACQKTANAYKAKGRMRDPRGMAPNAELMLADALRLVRQQQRNQKREVFDTDGAGKLINNTFNPKVAGQVVALAKIVESLVDAVRKWRDSEASRAEKRSTEENAQLAMDFLASSSVSLETRRRALVIIAASLKTELQAVK